MEIEYKQKINEELSEWIDNELTEYEKANNVLCNYKPFYFIAKEKDKVIGAITGYTCYEEVYIDDLVVLKEYRHNGVGTALINAVENHYKDKAFNNMNLVTNEFQAPEFYKKVGFELEFIRKNKNNSKLNKYFFVKYF